MNKGSVNLSQLQKRESMRVQFTRFLTYLLLFTVTGVLSASAAKTRGQTDRHVELVVADTVIEVQYDTIYTGCFAITVGNNGNVGNRGVGSVNLDYEALDWKENQNVYLYDAGTVVADAVGADTNVNWGMYSTAIADSVSLIPLGDQTYVVLGLADMCHTGVYVTNDFSIALESKFYAPRHSDSCNIVIKRTMVHSNDGNSHRVSVGEVADFNIPNDSNGSFNTSGDGTDAVFAETGAQLVYLQGVDISPDTAQDTTAGSWFAAERYGVLQYLGGHRISLGVMTPDFPVAHGMYSASNPRFVDPYPAGFDQDSLYMQMSLSSSNISDSVQDLHIGCSYLFEYDLAATDTLVFSIAYITNLNASFPYASKASSGIAGSVEKAAKLWLDHFSTDAIPDPCCSDPGDFNDDGTVNVSDVSGPTSIVAFMFGFGPEPPCIAQGDFDGDGSIDIADLAGPHSIIAYMWQGGPEPVCGSEW